MTRRYTIDIHDQRVRNAFDNSVRNAGFPASMLKVVGDGADFTRLQTRHGADRQPILEIQLVSGKAGPNGYSAHVQVINHTDRRRGSYSFAPPAGVDRTTTLSEAEVKLLVGVASDIQGFVTPTITPHGSRRPPDPRVNRGPS